MIPQYSPVGEHVTDSSLSSGKTIKVDPKANAILVQAITQNVRLKLNGTATATEGFAIIAGHDPILIPIGSGTISIVEAAGSAALEYQFVKINRSL